MARYQIVTIGDEVLKYPAKAVTKFDERIQKLIAQMEETVREENGVGLAAPQVGISKRVILVLLEEEDRFLPMINPEILDRQGGEVLGQEGCLSVPGKIGMVKRWDKLTVRYQDPEGRVQELEAQGMLARIIQHEEDHLNGILFIQRAEQVEDF